MRLLVAAAFVALSSMQLEAQRTHVLIVTGLGGEPQYSTAFAEQGKAFHELARTQWKVADSSLVWLAEDPSREATRIRGKSTKEAVGEAFIALSRQVSAGDLVVVLLIGHGSGEGKDSRVNLPGADATVADYQGWLAALSRQTVVLVNTASASGDFVTELKGANRVIVTSTRTALERNESIFGGHFVRGLSSAEADANKDGATSVMEAFTYASREVVRVYEEEKRMLTEHATVSDSVLAARVSFAGGTAASDDPKVVALVAERRAIEEQLTALRARKDSMPAADYEKELERLLVAIAEKTQQIRAAGGRP